MEVLRNRTHQYTHTNPSSPPPLRQDALFNTHSRRARCQKGLAHRHARARDRSYTHTRTRCRHTRNGAGGGDDGECPAKRHDNRRSMFMLRRRALNCLKPPRTGPGSASGVCTTEMPGRRRSSMLRVLCESERMGERTTPKLRGGERERESVDGEKFRQVA